ncbi:MAG: prephenate dehydratase domain-containing protein [Verrucomicrobium sp.]|nr:prephenate dehydratase domain-containing protein [Verrucomicrobium sp.]
MSAEVGYFGEEGSFSHRAAARRFPGAALRPFSLVGQAFAALGEVAQIVVPIENASSGVIPDTIDHLITALPAGAAVRECLAMPIALALLARKAGEEVRVVYSHAAALAHARTWLAAHYPAARLVPVESTSLAAKRAWEEPGAAALAGDQAALLYGLETVRADVQAGVPNRTKFYVIGKPVAGGPAATHTALVCELPHTPGSLVGALQAVAAQGLNLTMIQSRPIPGRFDEYRFFLEYEGTGEAALDALRPATTALSVLGRYPIVEIA